MACGITSDYIYKMLQSAEKEESETGCRSTYDRLFQEADLKKAETKEEQKEARLLSGKSPGLEVKQESLVEDNNLRRS